MNKIDPKTSVLLIMDCQVRVLNHLPSEEKEKVLSNLVKVLKAARKFEMLVIFIIAQFRRGYPEVSSRSNFFARLKEKEVMMEGNPEVEICCEIRPQDVEVIIAKKRQSA